MGVAGTGSSLERAVDFDPAESTGATF